MTENRPGNIIASRRKELGLTAHQLARRLNVSEQTITNWEAGVTMVGKGRFIALSDILRMPESALRGETPFYAAPDNVGEHLFSEPHMYEQIRSSAVKKNWKNTAAALEFAKKSHAGQTRKGNLGIPYIMHPLNVACHAMALGIEEDEVIAAALLHDVCEDCGVSPEDLPVSDDVKEAVRLLTRIPVDGESKEETLARYYGAISKNRIATIVKLMDRCNNVSFMTFAFSDKKLRSYIAETRTWILPLLEEAVNRYPVYKNAYFLIKYHIGSVINSIDVLLTR